MPKSRSPDWTAIAVAYRNGMPVSKIFRDFRISRKAFYTHSEKEGWPLRKKGLTPKRLQNRKKALLLRSFTLIEQKLKILEKELDSTDENDAQQHARDTNTLSTIVNLIDKLTTLYNQVREDNDRITGADNYDQAERLRTGLAKRLNQIHDQPD